MTAYDITTPTIITCDVITCDMTTYNIITCNITTCDVTSLLHYRPSNRKFSNYTIVPGVTPGSA
jgi:hypothetical protein